MENDVIQANAKIAAEWWGSAIRNPKFDAGADSPALAMAEAIARGNVSVLLDEQVQTFVNYLQTYISDMLPWDSRVDIVTDYGPDALLSRAALLADIPVSNFPWKTRMVITADNVKVAYGYGSGYVQLT